VSKEKKMFFITSFEVEDKIYKKIDEAREEVSSSGVASVSDRINECDIYC